ncbi:STAS domain-containing protein [Actinophytocola sp. KF-1]
MTDTEFDVSIAQRADATVLHVRGEVDLATAPALRLALAGITRVERELVVIDLVAVTFLSSAGLLVLVEATEAGRPEVRVVAPGRECLRPIRMTGLDSVLSIHGTLADALRQAL